MTFQNSQKEISVERWKELIEAKAVSSVKMRLDNTIAVRYLILIKYKGSNLCSQQVVVYKENEPSAIALLKITGPLFPGEIFFFDDDELDEPYHNIPSPEEVSQWLEKKEIRKVAMRENKYIELWGYFEQKECFTFSGEEYAEVFEKYTGPMKPGDEFYFQKDDE